MSNLYASRDEISDLFEVYRLKLDTSELIFYFFHSKVSMV